LLSSGLTSAGADCFCSAIWRVPGRNAVPARP
jgi:hypothetical protein